MLHGESSEGKLSGGKRCRVERENPSGPCACPGAAGGVQPLYIARRVDPRERVADGAAGPCSALHQSCSMSVMREREGTAGAKAARAGGASGRRHHRQPKTQQASRLPRPAEEPKCAHVSVGARLASAHWSACPSLAPIRRCCPALTPPSDPALLPLVRAGDAAPSGPVVRPGDRQIRTAGAPTTAQRVRRRRLCQTAL